MSLTLKKTGVEDVEISVAEDAVDEVEEEEAPQVQATPRQKSNFRASFGGSPGSAAIYSSPAYMRKAAKYSYLDGISRLFEDEWDNQDLPRKKARTSIGDVKSWKMVDRTPSPERPSSGVAVQEDQEMGEADAVKDTIGDMEDPPAAESITSQVPPSKTPPQTEQEPRTTESVEPVDPPATARKSLEGQVSISLPATNLTSTLPRLQLPSASPTPQISQAETEAAPTIDPVTPRLIPLSSTTLPSTTPQISPLATKNAFSGQVDAGLSENGNDVSQAAEIPESHAEVEANTLAAPNPTTNNPLEQDQPSVTEHKSVAEVIAATTPAGPVIMEEIEVEDAPTSSKSDDLAEEDAFSDDEADEVLSAYEKDGEMMYEDDAEDVFDADGLEGEEPSDDETIKDSEMHQSPLDDQSVEDATSEEDSDVEEPASDQIQNDVAAQPTASTPEREVYKQPSFTSASTLLRDEDTRAINTKSPIEAELSTVATPFKKPTFRVDGVLPSTEVVTPVARTAEPPNRTPQSVRDKVMKRTFSSLFGLKGTPSPEKEDPIVLNKESNGEEKSEIDRLVNEPSASETEVPLNHGDRYMGLDGQDESEEARPLDNVALVSAPTDQGSSPKDHDMLETNDMRSVTAREMFGQLENDEPSDLSPKDQNLPESQPAKLINLDSDSDEEARVEEIAAEQASESYETSPPVVAPTANEHSDVKSNTASVQQDVIDVAVPEPIVVDAEQASSEHSVSEQPQSPEHLEEVLAAPNHDNRDVTMLQPSEAPESVREDVFDVAMPESILVDGEGARSEHNVPEQQQSLNRGHQEEQTPTPNANEQDAPMAQSSEAPESVHASFIPDSMEQSAVSPDGTLSPEFEVQNTYPVEPELSAQAPPEQSQPFDSVADFAELAHEPDQPTNGPETLPEILDSLPPLVNQQEQEPKPTYNTPEKLSDLENYGQTNPVEVDDVDMLDAQEREHESQSLSFESQVEQDNIDAQEQEPGTKFASFESQVVQESVDEQRQERESPLASFGSQVVQDSVDVRQQEPEASASFESQVIKDSISAQQPEPEASLASFESQVVQESTSAQQPEITPSLVTSESQAQESVDAQQQELDSPLVSVESQEVQDSIDAQMSGMQEHSSRPVSRDTEEDFSPYSLDPFPKVFQRSSVEHRPSSARMSPK